MGDRITINGVELECRPPVEPGTEEVYLLPLEVLKGANQLLDAAGWQWVQVGKVGSGPVYEMREVGDGS